MLVASIYFEGDSSTAISSAFVLGCALSMIMSLAQLLSLFGLGWAVTQLLAFLRPPASKYNKKWKSQRVMADAFDTIAQAATQDADERDTRMLQLQIVLKWLWKVFHMVSCYWS
jgi:hypothetical protein